MGHISELCDPSFRFDIYAWPRIQSYIDSEYLAAPVILRSAFSMGHLPVKPFGPLKRFRYQLMKNNLHVERAIKKMTQADVADKVGVSRQTINSIESNKYIPSTLLALKIARVFGKSVEDIFQLEKKDL
jgi:putative transcriptional regulator